MGRHGVEQVGHHFQVDHRGFVHHQHIQRQAIARVMPEMAGPGTAAEQAVHGGDVRRDLFPYRFGDFQGANLGTDGLRQPRRGFAGGGGETDAQGFACLHRWRLEQRQQAHDGRGFAGARATGDNAESAAGRQGAGELLPVDHFTGPGRAEQAGQALG
ncbi:hypothetical protein D3C86_1538390 [compost metagenome]